LKIPAILLAFILAAASSAALAGSIERAIDGDDICLCGDDAFVRRFAGRSKQCDPTCVRVRLCGIDAAERGEPGYRESADELARLSKGNATCIAVGDGTPCDGRSQQFNRDRVVAQCFVEGGDLARQLVESGHACDWLKFSDGFYSRQGAGKPCPEGHRRSR
jgi:endonuclease YncB( thermonuclease family)